MKASYAKAGSRDQLSKDPVFGQEFERAKQRVNTMDIRFVEETDAVRQALLEIYVALALETIFNDFDNPLAVGSANEPESDLGTNRCISRV